MKHILFFLLLSFGLSAQSLNWRIENQSFNAGDTVPAKFFVDNFTGIGSYSFTFKADTNALKFHLINFTSSRQSNFNQLEYLPENADSLLGKMGKAELDKSASVLSPIQITGVLPMGQGNFSWYGKPGYALTPGEMRTLWSNPQGKTIPNNSHVFTVWFIAKTSGTICSKFQLWPNHPVLKPRAYKANPLTLIPITFGCVEVSFKEQVEDRSEVTEVLMFPNPVTEYLTIQSTEPVRVEVFNLSGSLTFNSTVVGELNLDLEQGVNFVKVTKGKESFVKKIIKI